MSAPYGRAPAELPDLRLWLMDQWRPGAIFHEVSTRVLADRAHELHGALIPDMGAIAAWEQRQARAATLWWVGEEMVDLLLASAASIPDDVRIEDLPKPSSAGMVVLAKPWMGSNAAAGRPDQEPVAVSMLVWGTDLLTGTWGPTGEYRRQVPAVSVSTYERLVFEDGLGRLIETAAQMGCLEHARYKPLDAEQIDDDPHGTFVYDNPEMGPDQYQAVIDVHEHEGHTPGEAMRDVARKQQAFSLHGCSWMPLGRSDWPTADTLGTPPWEMSDESAASFIEDRKVLAALWTLLQTKALTRTQERPADRPARRRSERAGIRRELSTVRTITLRQPDRTATDADHEAQPGRYSHRWVVQPHFCWQPYGPGRAQRKLILRGPYIKGPADKPLHTPEVVRAWVR